jgi:hypothetical protein
MSTKVVGKFKLGNILSNALIFVLNLEFLMSHSAYIVLTEGAGKVIRGWDVGISGNQLNLICLSFSGLVYSFVMFNVGMRVGDKRRLTVPPSMWCTFDII